MIPVYNGKNFLKGAIDSALAQGDCVAEVVVVDNCSTDGTWEYLQTLSYEKLRIHQNPRNLGLFGNFNQCLSLARSPLVLTLCVDDRLYPKALQDPIRIIQEHPEVALVNCYGDAVDENGQQIKTLGDRLRPGLYSGAEIRQALYLFHSRTGINPFNYPSGILLNMKLLRGKIEFSTEFRKTGDIDFYYRALQLGDLAIAEQKVCAVTFHSAQQGQAQRGEVIELLEYERILETFGGQLDRQLAKEIRSNFHAIALWRGMQFLARLNLKAFSRHARFAFSRSAPLDVIFRLGAFVSLRLRRPSKRQFVSL